MPPHWKKDRRRQMLADGLANRPTSAPETGTEQDEPHPRVKSLRTGNVQGVPGRWRPGESGNPGGRPAGERALLRQMYGRDGAAVYRRLEQLRKAADTPPKLKAEIDFFIIERLFGKAQQQVELGAHGSLAELIAAAVALSEGR